MAEDLEMITRKAIDTSGQLGSFYDVICEKLIDSPPYKTSSTHMIDQRTICKIFSGLQSIDSLNYLKEIGIDDHLQLSILCGMINSTEVNCLIDSLDDSIHLFYYSYRSREEQLILTREHINDIRTSRTFPTRVTHMICKILWGFEVLCVLPSLVDVQPLLQNISERLKNSENELILTDVEKQTIAQLNDVIVYHSQRPTHILRMSLLRVLMNLKQWQREENDHYPLMYTMCSIQDNASFPEKLEFLQRNNLRFPTSRITMSYIGQIVIDVRRLFDRLPEKLLDSIFDREQSDSFLQSWNKLQERLRKILFNIRRTHRQLIGLNATASDQLEVSLRKDLQRFSHMIHRCYDKLLLVKRITDDDIRYINAKTFWRHKRKTISMEYCEKKLRRFLLTNHSSTIILCCNDQLKEEDPALWEYVYQQFLGKGESKAGRICLVYVDFTNCHCNLEYPTITTVSAQMVDNARHHRTDRSPLQQPSSAPITEINVLLLGESGVGKSTFINAFVNYLVFDTLQQAQDSEPVVLIPVSFLTTVGDHFDEVFVKFGHVDDNEDHEHQGQSVTQHCRSYVFHLNDRLILRLIDSPGMGDTRGLVQDERNMEHILSYVSNLSHLNAVCLLLKPNASRLNIFLRSCINQLFTYLTPIGYENIIFCFTNSRATFFAPGDTGPVLRQMLHDEQYGGIPFGKANTFCFDSESFRYLAARKCDVEFDDFQEEECTKSWTISVKESVRLLQYILQRIPYHMDEYRSPRKAILDISTLVRPSMDILRVMLYNRILVERNIRTHKIILECNPLSSEACRTKCLSCRIVPLGPLFTTQLKDFNDDLSQDQRVQFIFGDTNLTIDYIANHHYVEEPPSRIEELTRWINDVLGWCSKLSIFFRGHQEFPIKMDPFALILDQFIDEERFIVQSRAGDTTLNGKLLKQLISILERHRERSEQAIQSKETPQLHDIYQTIDQLKNYGPMQNPLDAIRKSRQLKMKASEKQIAADISSYNKLFTEFIRS